MLKFLRKVFGKDGETTVPSEPAPAPAPAAHVPRPVENAGGGIEVAALSLRAILEKLPPDLRALVNQLPGPETKIVLPINTILKQLPSGAVKMSFGGLLRQSPPGTFRKAQIEEKQMVDVPLAEVFKTVNPARLNLRTGQRQYDVPDEAVGLFGQDGQTRSVVNPGASAPAAQTPKAVEPDPTAMVPAPEPAPVPEAPKILRMPGISDRPASGAVTQSGQPPTPAPAAASAPERRAAAKPPQIEPGGDLILPLVELAATWPEGIRGELSIFPGDTKLVLPAFEVSAGLQKGKVSFPWSQLRGWLRPAFSGQTGIPDDYQLVLALRIVAPAFVAATGGVKRKVDPTIDQTLPDFFGPTSGQSQPAAPVQSAAAATPPVAPASAPAPAGKADATAETQPVPKIPLTLNREASAPVTAAIPSSAPTPPKELTLRELFRQPGKSSWTPAELVSQTCELPGITGAVIALEEGLVVAQKLPEGLAAETFAAFMPQIFGRIERYTREMQLGDVAEILIQSASGPCQLFRIGRVFFAILGRPAEPLPAGLKLIAAELASHHQ